MLQVEQNAEVSTALSSEMFTAIGAGENLGRGKEAESIAEGTWESAGA